MGSVSMHPELRLAYQDNMYRAKQAYHAKAWREAFGLLERAHILGQHYAIAHTRVHIWMFKVAWRRGDVLEMLGQFVRIVGGFFGSLFGKVPVGNSGGADVSAFAVMPIPEDLRAILIKDEKSWQAIKNAPNKGKA